MTGAGANDHMVVSPDDHRAYVVIACILGLIWSALVILIRIFIRLQLTGPFGTDDAAACLATLIGACQTAVVLYSVREGVGVRYNDDYRDRTESGLKAYYASQLLYILAICPAKASMSLLISRVSRQAADKHLTATQIVTGLIFLWGVASIFIVAFQCTASRPWDLSGHGHCTGIFPRWAVVESLSIVIEVLISALAFSFVLGLDMAFRTKAIVITAFSAQLLVAIPVGFRLWFLHQAVRKPGALMFTLANLSIATQAVMHFSIMAATFPCFRQFLQAFNNDFGATTKMGTDITGSRSHENSANSYAMSNPTRSRNGGSGQTTRNHESDTDVETGVFRPPPTSRGGTATPADDGRSLQSMGSERAIVKNKQKRA